MSVLRSIEAPGAAVSRAAMHASTIAETIEPITTTILLIPSTLPWVGWRQKVRTPAPLRNGASMTACKD